VLSNLQRALASEGRWYPPVPTFDGAFVGGTIATNAAGAATFKYGSTRPWVEAITVVLADGSVLDVQRGEVTASPEGWFELERASGEIVPILIPTYTLPDVAKLSAGYFARPGMDLIDLFIGAEGTLGVIVDATLRTLPKPRTCMALVTCATDAQALALTAALRHEAITSWHGHGALDVSAIEYMGEDALAVLPGEAWARAGVQGPAAGSCLLLVQIEVPEDDSATLARFAEVLTGCGVGPDPAIAGPGDERGAARLFELREAVPAAVNAQIAETRTRVSPHIHKIAGDYVVPFDRLADSLALYRRICEQHGLPLAVWGHASDGNLHPNVLPRSAADVERGLQAIFEMAMGVMAMGGAPLAEHGVGRHPVKRRLLRALYGDRGIEEMRAVKRALDPEWKLAAGVLFPQALTAAD
jgi:D-lactate dehydrogenase (cytochrome)